MLLLDVVSLKSCCSRNNYCIDDSLRWCGILFLIAPDKLAASTITASSGVTVGFVMYLYLENTVPDTIGAHVSFTHRFQHW